MPEDKFYEIKFYIRPILSCQYCHNNIEPKNSIILLMPGKNEGCEFCGIKCLLKYMIRLVRRKTVNKQLKVNNLLENLGFLKPWGIDISNDIKKAIPKEER